MAVLKGLKIRSSKRLKAATLIESLVASVIIITIFTIASLTLNNVFKGSIEGNTSDIENRMNELEYLVIHDKIAVPYAEDYKKYQITIRQEKVGILSSYIMEFRKGTSKTSKQRIIYDN